MMKTVILSVALLFIADISDAVMTWEQYMPNAIAKWSVKGSLYGYNNRLMAIDGNDVLWFAMYDGTVYGFDTSNESWRVYPWYVTGKDSTDSYSCGVYADRDNSTWYFNSNSIIRFDGSDWWRFVFNSSTSIDYEVIRGASDILQGDDGTFWIAAKYGIIGLSEDLTTETMFHTGLERDTTLVKDPVYPSLIVANSEGRILVVASKFPSGTGVMLINENGTWHVATEPKGFPAEILGKYVTMLDGEGDTALFIDGSTFYNTIMLWSDGRVRSKMQLSNAYASAIGFDIYDNAWAALWMQYVPTSKPSHTTGYLIKFYGLAYLRKDLWTITYTSTVADRFKGVYAICADSRNRKWFLTDTGLWCLTDETTEVDSPSAPAPFKLDAPSPNPFNASVTLSFTFQKDENAELAVYSLTGQKIRTIADDAFDAGTHRAVWDGRDEAGNAAASGVYLFRLRAGGRAKTVRVVMVR